MLLKDLTELICDNDDCVVLKVKDNCNIELICLGYFRGDETMFRLTKGEKVTCTIFYKDDSPLSFYWGNGGYTLVSENTRKAGNLIQDCIQNDYKIQCNFSYRKYI